VRPARNAGGGQHMHLQCEICSHRRRRNYRSLVTTDNNLDVATSEQTYSLKGTATAAPVTVKWQPPAAIPAGTALTAKQLDAEASVAGKFVYSPAAEPSWQKARTRSQPHLHRKIHPNTRKQLRRSISWSNKGKRFLLLLLV